MRRSGSLPARNTTGNATSNATGLAPGDVASATWTIAQLALFAAAGASLGVVVSSYSKTPHTMRDATIGAIALPVLAVLLPPRTMATDCTPAGQAQRSLVTALFGAGLGVLLSRTIAPTHPALGALGGAFAGLVYAGAVATSCAATPDTETNP